MYNKQIKQGDVINNQRQNLSETMWVKGAPAIYQYGNHYDNDKWLSRIHCSWFTDHSQRGCCRDKRFCVYFNIRVVVF